MFITGLELYAGIKFWLPMLTAACFVVKAWQHAVNGITSFGDKLLNNHLHGIEEATKETAETNRAMCGTLIEIHGLSKETNEFAKKSVVETAVFRNGSNTAQKAILDKLDDMTLLKAKAAKMGKACKK